MSDIGHFFIFGHKSGQKSISNPQYPHYFLSPLLHKTMRKQPPCHSFPQFQYSIIRQPDISIHIDLFPPFHAVIGASSHVAVLNHFIVCNTQFSESSYRKIAQAIALRLEVSIVFQILRKKSKECINMYSPKMTVFF